MPQVLLTITGRVQGVGFRAFTRAAADRLGVRGAVWNTRQGTVEAVAEHDDSDVLERFCASLENGPGYVQQVHKAKAEVQDLGPGFEIRPTI